MRTIHIIGGSDLALIEQGLALLVTSGFEKGDYQDARFLLQRLKLEALLQARQAKEITK